MPKPYRITIDLSKHPKVFDRIAASAARENRSVSKQVLHEVMPTLERKTKP